MEVSIVGRHRRCHISHMHKMTQLMFTTAQHPSTAHRICRPRNATGTTLVNDFSMRFEFQGRGTLHVHVVAWVNFDSSVGDGSKLSGQSSKGDPSKLVQYLANVFRSSIDVQCAQGEHCLLRYVTGYATKASDSLRFAAQDRAPGNQSSSWRQVYRMLCKTAPMEQEMIMEFAGKPYIICSFCGDAIYAPVPGSTAQNKSRDAYNAYLEYWKHPANANKPLINFGRSGSGVTM